MDAKEKDPRPNPAGSTRVAAKHGDDVLDAGEEIWSHNDLGAPELPNASVEETDEADAPPPLEDASVAAVRPAAVPAVRKRVEPVPLPVPVDTDLDELD